MTISKSIEEMLEDAVTGGLQGFLGDNAKVLNVFLDPSLAVRKPDSYVNSLSRLLPPDKNVETLVLSMCRLLYEDLGLPFEERSGWKLSDYVNDATGKVRDDVGETIEREPSPPGEEDLDAHEEEEERDRERNRIRHGTPLRSDMLTQNGACRPRRHGESERRHGPTGADN